MKIQLVRYHDTGNVNSRLQPSLNRRQGVLPPLGLAYIAAALEQAGHQVEVLDAIALGLSGEACLRRMRAFAPQVVGITAMTPTFRGAREAACLAKRVGAITLMGGVHLSLYPRETLACDCIDYGILGEGEESVVELCAALENRTPVAEIAGIAYKENGRVVVGSPRIIERLDRLPTPAYHLLPMERYSSIIGGHRVSSIMGSRGCPYRCGFCFKTASDRRYRRRSAEHIVDEMALLKNRYGVTEILFYDDLMPPAYAADLCTVLLERGLNLAWQTPQRVDLVRPDLLARMAKAGCRLLRFGVEQGDPEMMQRIEKRTTLEQVLQSFQWARDAGIDTFAYFIIGYLGETEESMQKTIALAKRLDPAFVMFTRAVPLPQTPLMAQAVAAGLVADDYWRRFTLGEDLPPIPPLVPHADGFVKRAYRAFYLRPHYIMRQARKIRTLGDLKKNLSGLLGVLGR